MLRFELTIKELLDAKSIVETLYNQEEPKLNYSQERDIRPVFVEISNKVSLIIDSQVALETRIENYTTEGIDRIKKILEFRDNLNSQGIYPEDLKRADAILSDLMSANEVSKNDLENLQAVLEKLKNYLDKKGPR